MTATERLRQLLDERGVEWHGTGSVYGDDFDATESVWKDDALDVTLYGVSPEQAIAATLGRGTCEDELREALADLWPRASFTMCPENRVSWLERLAELGVEVDA